MATKDKLINLEDLKVLSDHVEGEVTDLKSEITDVGIATDVVVFGNSESIPTEWLEKSIYYVTGGNSTSTMAIRTAQFDISKYKSVLIAKEIYIYVFVYDENGTYLGYYNKTSNCFTNSQGITDCKITDYLNISSLLNVRSVIDGKDSLIPSKIIISIENKDDPVQNLDWAEKLTFVTSSNATIEQLTNDVGRLISKEELNLEWSQSSTKSYPFQLTFGRKYIYTNTGDSSINLYIWDKNGQRKTIFTSVTAGKSASFVCEEENVVQVGGYAAGQSSATLVSEDVGVYDAINKAIQTVTPEDTPDYTTYSSVSLFETIGAVGDSYTSGGLYDVPNVEGGSHYSISWPQVLARRCGINATNYSKGGYDISRWLQDENIGLPKLVSDAGKNLYVIVMGINEEKSLSDVSVSVGVGSVSDIDLSDPSQNADTFCGHYGRMLSGIIDHAPSAKIILVKPLITSVDKKQAIDDIATLYGLPVFAMDDEPYYSTSFYASNKYSGHPIAITYAGMALAFERQITQCIVDNVSYFTDYTGT